MSMLTNVNLKKVCKSFENHTITTIFCLLSDHVQCVQYISVSTKKFIKINIKQLKKHLKCKLGIMLLEANEKQ